MLVVTVDAKLLPNGLHSSYKCKNCSFTVDHSPDTFMLGDTLGGTANNCKNGIHHFITAETNWNVCNCCGIFIEKYLTPAAAAAAAATSTTANASILPTIATSTSDFFIAASSHGAASSSLVAPNSSYGTADRSDVASSAVTTAINAPVGTYITSSKNLLKFLLRIPKGLALHASLIAEAQNLRSRVYSNVCKSADLFEYDCLNLCNFLPALYLRIIFHKFEGIDYCVVFYAEAGHFCGSFESKTDGSSTPLLLQDLARLFQVDISNVLPVAIRVAVNLGFLKTDHFLKQNMKAKTSALNDTCTTLTNDRSRCLAPKEARLIVYFKTPTESVGLSVGHSDPESNIAGELVRNITGRFNTNLFQNSTSLSADFNRVLLPNLVEDDLIGKAIGSDAILSVQEQALLLSLIPSETNLANMKNVCTPMVGKGTGNQLKAMADSKVVNTGIRHKLFIGMTLVTLNYARAISQDELTSLVVDHFHASDFLKVKSLKATSTTMAASSIGTSGEHSSTLENLGSSSLEFEDPTFDSHNFDIGSNDDSSIQDNVDTSAQPQNDSDLAVPPALGYISYIISFFQLLTPTLTATHHSLVLSFFIIFSLPLFLFVYLVRFFCALGLLILSTHQ